MLIITRRSATELLERILAADEADEYYDDGYHQKDMDKAPNRIRRNDAQKPKD